MQGTLRELQTGNDTEDAFGVAQDIIMFLLRFRQQGDIVLIKQASTVTMDLWGSSLPQTLTTYEMEVAIRIHWLAIGMVSDVTVAWTALVVTS